MGHSRKDTGGLKSKEGPKKSNRGGYRPRQGVNGVEDQGNVPGVGSVAELLEETQRRLRGFSLAEQQDFGLVASNSSEHKGSVPFKGQVAVRKGRQTVYLMDVVVMVV